MSDELYRRFPSLESFRDGVVSDAWSWPGDDKEFKVSQSFYDWYKKAWHKILDAKNDERAFIIAAVARGAVDRMNSSGLSGAQRHFLNRLWLGFCQNCMTRTTVYSEPNKIEGQKNGEFQVTVGLFKSMIICRDAIGKSLDTYSHCRIPIMALITLVICHITYLCWKSIRVNREVGYVR